MEMTIKKRIALSNILMVAIPALLAAVMVGLEALGVYLAFFRSGNQELARGWEAEEMRGSIVQQVQELLSQQDGAVRSTRAEELRAQLERGGMLLVVQAGPDEVLRLGLAEADEEALSQAAALLGPGALVADGRYELLLEQVQAAGETFQLRLYYPQVRIPEQPLKIQLFIFAAVLILSVLAAVIVVNRFLTRFLFRRIERPMDLLSAGVEQIRDGNLDYRIHYTQPDEFGAICGEFNEMAGRLRQSEEQERKNREARRTLLADISHDLRSPLTSILAYVEGLEDGVADTPEKQRKYLSIIKGKTSDIDRLVKKLFLFSKMEMGDYPYFPEKLDAGRELTDFMAAAREDYEKKGLILTLDSTLDHTVIVADPAYFRSVLTNLLDNSAKYRTRHIGHAAVRAREAQGQLCLMVDDDGPGVPEQELGQVFDVFYRTDPARKDPDQGSGLGLAIVAKIVGKMGGSIHAENLPQGGLRMVLTLPIMKGEEQHEADSDH